MSTTLAFWRGPETDDDGAVYLALGTEVLPHVEMVNADEVLDALTHGLPG